MKVLKLTDRTKHQLAEAFYAVASGALMFTMGMLIASGWIQ